MGDGGEGWDYEDESTSAAFTIRTLEETGITAKDGYTFSGWEYTPVTGEKKIYAAGDKVDLTELNVNIMNLAALWTAGTDETVKITYLPGEGAAGTGVVEDAASGAAFYLKGIDELGFSKEGSIFDKWKIDDSDDTLTDKAIFMAVKNTTFTATWKSGTAQVIIDYNYAGTEAEKTTYMLGETIDYDALVADLGDSLSRDGYTLIGFADDAMGTNLFLSSVDKHYTVTEDMTIYAVWAKNIDIEAVPEGNDAQKSTAQAVIDSMAAGNILDGSDAESKSLLVMVAENLANALKGITEEPVSMNIVLSKITSADDGKLQSITFDVTPVTESGKKIEKLNCWAGIIIPVPDELAEIAGYGKVNVNHGRDIYYAAIHGSEGKYYLHLSMDSFSPVTVSVPVEYDVTLKDGYGSGTKTVKLKSGDKMPGNPFKRSGYEFLGWLIPEESVNGTIDDDMNVIVTGEGFVMKALWISKSSSGGGGVCH